MFPTTSLQFRTRFTTVALSLVIGFGLTQKASAQDFWINPIGGFFDDNPNWADGSEPGMAESAVFNLDATYDVEWDNLTGNTFNDSLSITNGDVTFFSDGGPWRHTLDDFGPLSGFVRIDGGSLSLGRTSSEPFILDMDGGVSIQGGGQLNVMFGSELNQTPGITEFPTLSVGSGTGSGTLNVETGGKVQNLAYLRIGDGSSGFATIEGIGSSLDAFSIRVGKTGSVGQLNITSGGSVTSVFAEVVNGDAFIDGSGSSWTTERLEVGLFGQTGALTIRNGGVLTTTETELLGNKIGNGAGSYGEVTITGPGSSWNSTNFVSVGSDEGVGTLNVNSGASADFSRLSVYPAGSAMNVLDEGTIVTTSQGTRIGWGELTIANGGFLNDLSGSSSVGSYGDDGTATVTGSGSRWNNEELAIGVFADNASLNIIDGGIVNSGSARVGLDNSTAFVTVSGLGSQWNVAGEIKIRQWSGANGTVTVQDGGLVTADSINVGQFVSSSLNYEGHLNVTGAGSEVRVNNGLTVGGGTIGYLAIESGGSVESEFGIIGDGSTSTGTAIVTGAGSRWTNTDSLTVGLAGNGTLSIADSGLVSVGTSTTIGTTGNVVMSGGRLEFGTMEIENFKRIGGTSGSLAGDIYNAAYTDVAPLTGLQNNQLDMTDVTFNNSGTLHGTASLATSLINSGEIQTFAGEQMRFAGSGTNSGEFNSFGGMVRFDGSLTNNADSFIGGRGVLIANGGISNQGVMAFSGTTDLLGDIELTGNGSIITSGLGTVTTIFDDIVHNGSEIRTAAGNATVIFGAASGGGNYTGTGAVLFEGDLRPGNSPDAIFFEGDVLLGNSAHTFIEIAGLGFGDFDALLVAGDLELDGQLSVSLIDGFTLSANQEFLFADVDGSVFGQFDGLAQGDLVGNYGRFNLFIDYSAGDGNDIRLFSSSVPEPGSLTLLLLGFVGITVRRRRRVSA